MERGLGCAEAPQTLPKDYPRSACVLCASETLPNLTRGAPHDLIKLGDATREES